MTRERQIYGWFLCACAIALCGFSLWLAIERDFWPAWFLVVANLGAALAVAGAILFAPKDQS